MILRAHYQAMIWVADVNPIPDLPPPTDYGWSVEGDLYVPVPSMEPPAPQAVIELVKCNCKTSHCEKRCSVTKVARTQCILQIDKVPNKRSQ
jgi:hypothetical protein